MLKYYTLTLLAASMLLPRISAQSQEDLERLYDLPLAKDGDLLCRCISTFLPKKDETFFFKFEDEYHEVALVGEGISNIFPVRKDNTFTLYTRTYSEEGELIYLPVVEESLEGNGKDYIIVLNRLEGTTSIQAKTYNINTEDYSPNSLHLFNETGLKLGARVDDTNAVVAPFESHTHKFNNVSRNTYTSAKIAIAYKGEAKIMASKRLRLVPGRRFMMFCFPSRTRAEAGATPLKVITLQDMPVTSI